MAKRKKEMPPAEELLSLMDKPGTFGVTQILRSLPMYTSEHEVTDALFIMIRDKLVRVVGSAGKKEIQFELTSKGRKLARE